MADKNLKNKVQEPDVIKTWLSKQLSPIGCATGKKICWNAPNVVNLTKLQCPDWGRIVGLSHHRYNE